MKTLNISSKNKAEIGAFKIVKVAKDGNCLFSSIATFLKVPAKEIRRKAVEMISNNWLRFRTDVKINLELQLTSWNARAYSRYMNEDGNFGTSVELIAAAEVYDFTAWVFAKQSNNVCVYEAKGTAGDEEKPKLYLYFTGSSSKGHFEPLDPLVTPPTIRIGNYKIVKDKAPITIQFGKNAISHLNGGEVETTSDDLPAQPVTPVAIRKPTEDEIFAENVRLCEENDFQPPIPLKIFREKTYRYVESFDTKNLKSGKFLTAEQLQELPRNVDAPFCHPGPEITNSDGEWHLVDSIVQEVLIKGAKKPYFVVRWVGFEDKYNTVEPLANVVETGVYELFRQPRTYTASRSNNSAVMKSQVGADCGARTEIDEHEKSWCSKLVMALEVERKADKYSPMIGFLSKESTLEAFERQHTFTFEVFRPMMEGTSVCVPKTYIGEAFGALCNAKQFAKFSGISSITSLETMYNTNLRKLREKKPDGPNYVAFLVPRKLKAYGKADDFHLPLHMCALIIREKAKQRHAIYFDPSPKSFKHSIPVKLAKLKIQSLTHMFGTASGRDDCVYKVFELIMNLANDDAYFKVDESAPCRSLEKLKMKLAKSIE